MEIREARREELRDVLELLAEGQMAERREVVPDAPSPAHLAAFEAMSADPNQLLAAAIEDGRPVGTMQLTFIPGLARDGAWRMQLEGMRVRDGRRGGGIGAEMVRWAVERARERRCVVVQLSSDARRSGAQRFYVRLGFAPSHTGFKLWL